VSGRIRLRPIRVDDADAILAWINDPEITRNFAALGRITREQEVRFLEQTIASDTERLYAIETPDAELLGTAGIHRIHWPSRNGRLGIVIGRKDAHGKGFAQEGLRLLCGVAFRELGLHKVWLVHYATNERMRHVAKKLGFVEEGVLRDEYFHEGRFHDMVRHSLLEDELGP
jgi:RimJ/RimL family protein N-acetyltransferase